MRTAGELCTRDVVIIDRNAAMREAATLMREYHVGDLVVVETSAIGNRPVGILTDRDLVVEVIAEGVDLESVSAGDVMSAELLTVTADTGIHETIEQMRARAVRRCPVVDDKGMLAGIISIDDLLDILTEEFHDLISLVQQQPRREERARTAH